MKRILVTNDDGVNATGLKVLERIARKFSDDIWIVAPTEEQSVLTAQFTVRLLEQRPAQVPTLQSVLDTQTLPAVAEPPLVTSK